MFAHGAPLPPRHVRGRPTPCFFYRKFTRFYFYYFFETNPSAAAQLYVAGSVVVVVDDW